MRSGRRIVFVEAGRALECREGDVADPQPGGIVIRVAMAGVCGTDGHRLGGDLPSMGHPVTFGHEGVGEVEALGEGVLTDWGGLPLHRGDFVYWSGYQVNPASGRGDLPWPPPADEPNHATYQDYATLAPGIVFYRIPDDTSPEAVIAFGCAMPTALGGLGRLGGIDVGQDVVVQGCGPVGLASTMLAALSPARQVIVIGAPDHRLDAARRLGATTTIALDTTSPEERSRTVLELTDGRGVDVVIEATGVRSAFGEGMGLLAPDGRYLVLGLYSGSGTVDLDPVRVNNLNLRVIGSLGGNHEDLRRTIQLAQRYGSLFSIPDLITHRFPLSETEAAIATMKSGEAIKAVVIPGLGRS